jgi:hypothetical protein
MSGGSYNYLCYHTDGLEAQLGDIQSMAERCESLGHDDAAADTLRILMLLAEANRQAKTLEKAWKAIEWYDSCDWSLSQAQEALQEYSKQRTPVSAAPEHGTPAPPNLIGWRYVGPNGQVYVLTPEQPEEKLSQKSEDLTG